MALIMDDLTDTQPYQHRLMDMIDAQRMASTIAPRRTGKSAYLAAFKKYIEKSVDVPQDKDIDINEVF